MDFAGGLSWWASFSFSLKFSGASQDEETDLFCSNRMNTEELNFYLGTSAEKPTGFEGVDRMEI